MSQSQCSKIDVCKRLEFKQLDFNQSCVLENGWFSLSVIPHLAIMCGVGERLVLVYKEFRGEQGVDELPASVFLLTSAVCQLHPQPQYLSVTVSALLPRLALSLSAVSSKCHQEPLCLYWHFRFWGTWSQVSVESLSEQRLRTGQLIKPTFTLPSFPIKYDNNRIMEAKKQWPN